MAKWAEKWRIVRAFEKRAAPCSGDRSRRAAVPGGHMKKSNHSFCFWFLIWNIQFLRTGAYLC